MSLSPELLQQLQAVADAAIAAATHVAAATVARDQADADVRLYGDTCADGCRALWTLLADAGQVPNGTGMSFMHGGYVFTLRPGDTVFTLSKAPDLGSAFPLVTP